MNISHTTRMACCVAVLLIWHPAGLLRAAANDWESKLPPPATNQIDFTRDIKPILDTACLRCHGVEKSKGGFRIDNPQAALHGSENGQVIIPGNSKKSPLIHFVANLVEDLEMPPVGKGDPLTSEQVGLLRAWIDQGMVWDKTAPSDSLAYTITPIVGGTGVSGNSQKFRELNWQKDGLNGGLEEFELFQRPSPDTKVHLSGHALADDYKTVLSVDRNELGFIHTGWEQYRKYYDDTGGYYPSTIAPTTYSLGRDLHLDIGKAWIDFGLTLPHWPQMVLGYEYNYKNGEKSLTSWGNNNAGGIAPNIAPASKTIDESVHVIKFDLNHEIGGVTIEDRFRGEFYRLDTQYTNSAARSGAAEDARESTKYFQGANTLRLERKFNDWLFGSAGYLYSKLNADSAFTDTMQNFTLGATFENRAPEITLEKESHVFNLNGLIGPFSGLTITAGVQSEWTREQGFGGNAELNQINSLIAPISTRPAVPTTLSSDSDEAAVSESVAARYTKIPYTVLFAEARFQQQKIGEYQNDLQPSNPDGSYLQNTDFSSQMNDLRFGFHTSPWRSVSFSAHYRRYENDSHYENAQPPQPVGGYPGFIRGREVLTDEIEAKLVLRPLSWLKTSLAYRHLITDYHTDTDPAFTTIQPGLSPGGNLLSSQSDSDVYSLDAAFTPWRQLYLAATLSFQSSSTITANNVVPTIAPYRGDTYSAMLNGSYVFTETTDLFANYCFSQADFSQNNFALGLPVGLKYQQHAAHIGLGRRITKNVSAGLRYGFYFYEEPSGGGAANYTAHSIFGMVTVKLP